MGDLPGSPGAASTHPLFSFPFVFQSSTPPHTFSFCTSSQPRSKPHTQVQTNLSPINFTFWRKKLKTGRPEKRKQKHPSTLWVENSNGSSNLLLLSLSWKDIPCRSTTMVLLHNRGFPRTSLPSTWSSDENQHDPSYTTRPTRVHG
jgi:hypothetical protein